MTATTKTGSPASDGASPNQRLLFAAKQDSEDLFDEVLKAGGFDVNFRDGLGNTALHYAVSTPSPTVFELLLETEGTDVDIPDLSTAATPLHLAMPLSHPQLRQWVVSELLDAGADPRTKDKYGRRPVELLKGEGKDEDEIRAMLRRGEAEFELGMGDMVAEDDDDGAAGSGSDE